MNTCNLYPLPKNITKNNKTYYLNTKYKVRINEKYKNYVNLYSELWNNFSLGQSVLEFDINNRTDENMLIIGDGFAEEKIKKNMDFRINISEKGIILQGNNIKGIARAFTTVLQLIRPEGEMFADKVFLPCGVFEDKPLINFFGVHFCLFLDTNLDLFKRFIRLSGMCKVTHFIIEFWGTYKFECLKELGWSNSYGKDEITPYINEIEALGMEAIPMFNHLGHASQSRLISADHVVLQQEPKLAPLFEDDGWTWCLSNPNTLKIIKAIRNELCDLMPNSNYFHIGLDEAHSYASCNKCQDMNANNTYIQYLNYIAKDLRAKGKKCIMWGDSLLDKKKFSKEYSVNLSSKISSDQILNKLDKDIIIADWQYEVKDGELESSKYLLKQGFNVLCCPWQGRDNIDICLNTALNNNIGYLLTTWNDINPCLYSLLHSAEMVWNGKKSIEGAECIAISGNMLRKLCKSNQYGTTWTI